MSIINKILVLTSITTLLLLTSCEKDLIDEIVPIEPLEVQTEEVSENPLIKGVGKMSPNGFTIECITFTYPFEFKLESGNIVTVSDDNEAETALYNEDDYVIDFVYPVEAVNQNGEPFIINNIDELTEAFVECIPTEGWDDFQEEGFPAFDFEGLCVELTYPFTLQSYDESTMVVNNEQEFADALATGYYYFSFPINVIDLEGNTITISDDMALMDALFDCEGYYNYYYEHLDCPFDFSFCFEIVYPVGLVDEAGNVSNVDNPDDLYNLLFSGRAVDFIYPITLISEDGTTEEVDDANAINELLEDCFSYDYGYYPPFYYYDFCFAIDYPVDFTDVSGNAQTANNEGELYGLMYSGEVTDFVYPITITFQDGTITTVSDQNELNNIIDECPYNYEYDYEYEYEEIEDNMFALLLGGELFCFDINYPIIIIVNDVEKTVNDESEFASLDLFSGYDTFPVIEIGYPVTVTSNSDDSTTTFTEDTELIEYIDNCP